VVSCRKREEKRFITPKWREARPRGNCMNQMIGAISRVAAEEKEKESRVLELFVGVETPRELRCSIRERGRKARFW